MPYGDCRLGMQIVLPGEGKVSAAFIQDLNSRDWSEWMKMFQEKEGYVKVPRFKVEYGKSLTASLVSMGMGPAFGGSAFQAMAPVDPIFIGRVMQKTYIDVNEEGTEAAAVTGMVMTTGLNPNEPFVMNIDRPFFFAITDSATQTILFMGSIVDP